LKSASGNPVAVEALLEAGANVNAKDNNGSTPMDAVMVDLQTLSLLDPANLPPEKQQIYTMLRQNGGRHGN